MTKRTRGAQPVAKCGKCGGEDCAFKGDIHELHDARINSVSLRPSADGSMAIGCDWTAKRVEHIYEITCSICGWSWQQLVRETDTIEAVSLTKVFSITGLVIAALILLTLASLNIAIVGWF